MQSLASLPAHSAFHRIQVSLVAQEPVLFARSIRENILYGVDETQPVVSSSALSLTYRLLGPSVRHFTFTPGCSSASRLLRRRVQLSEPPHLRPRMTSSPASIWATTHTLASAARNCPEDRSSGLRLLVRSSVVLRFCFSTRRLQPLTLRVSRPSRCA